MISLISSCLLKPMEAHGAAGFCVERAPSPLAMERFARPERPDKQAILLRKTVELRHLHKDTR